MLSAAKIADRIQGRLTGNPDLEIKGVCDLPEGKVGHISFLANPAYYRYFTGSKAAAVIVGEDFEQPAHGKTLIHVSNVMLGFAQVLQLFNQRPSWPTGIHPDARIHETAQIGGDVSIDALAAVGPQAIIGNRCRIGAGAVVGSNTKLGDDVTLHPNVTIYDSIVIGDRVTIDAGSVIGADGFGWVTYQGAHQKVPQIGGVVIEDDVCIGVNCCVDRGTFGDTRIGAGTKMDNLIQIGHNVEIGKHCLIVSQVGVGGSTVIGDYVTLAGQVGIIDHLVIGSRSVVASKSAVTSNLEEGSFVSGVPAREHRARLRQDVVITKLPDLLKRIRTLEDQLARLVKEKN